ncbi:uncharacterized protein LOC112577351 [Pomacea canaliculata]|uniref:uncharacterized protein LOC112577351 n=1 Tax=Pomacea canaliculata TaxID=400727 RepID=UPI000D72C9B0|nr:uncharacterized protein LOC112577351 [Pomacea canaliculata]
MTTTHQLMAAAFYLCGLLFLLHVDSVNSLRCKSCGSTDFTCETGNDAPAVICNDGDKYCIVIRVIGSTNQGTFRGCFNEPVNRCVPKTILGVTYQSCSKTCSSDFCNSQLSGN